jgi:Flp pilus assembly protein TadB
MRKMRNMKQIDFSQNAIKKEVTSRILQHPISIYAILFGGVGLFFWLINLFGGVILFVAIGVLAVGAIGFIVNYFRKDSIQMKYVTLLNAQMQQHKERLVTRLKQ